MDKSKDKKGKGGKGKGTKEKGDKQKKPRKSAGVVDEMTAWLQSKQLIKPDDQLELTDAELKDEIPRLICSENPNKPDNVVEFSYAKGTFVPVSTADNTVVLLNFTGTCLHMESDEAIEQMVEQGIDPADIEAMLIQLAQRRPEHEGTEEHEQGEGDDYMEGGYEQEGEGGEEQEVGEEEEAQKPHEDEHEHEGGDDDEGHVAAPPEVKAGGKPKKLTNQFNFCERAALTYNNPFRNVDTQTVPAPMSQYGDTCYQWLIYDAMEADFEAQQKEKEKETKKPKVSDKAKKEDKLKQSDALTLKLFEAWKILERMVNQNTYDDIAQDYRYWDDPADVFREEEGTLLPLWKWTHYKITKHTVTDLCFSPTYYDLFVVTFGSNEYLKQPEQGAFGLFTLKNPSYPEYMCMTPSGAICVDVNPNVPYLLVIGFFDGTVAVYNVQLPPTKPQFMSDAVRNKHSSIVWEVKWGPDQQDGEKNFYSCSADGKINHWILMLNDLADTTIITLLRSFETIPGPDGTTIPIKGSGTCITFHPEHHNIFLVGTQEGKIHKCSTEYSASYLMTYDAHVMPVYRIDYNKYNSDIFVSCSADWRIKVWEDNREECLFVFDLNASVGDVQWAPYSSTVFAACTQEGKMYVFDLNVNKYKPICIQPVVSRRRNKLTRFKFNYNLPFIICGDFKGTITSLKLSPNLRLMCKPPKKQQYLDQKTLQIMKLDKLLSLVREPAVLPEKDLTVSHESN